MLNLFRKKPQPTPVLNTLDALPFDVEFGGITYKKGSPLTTLIAKAEQFKNIGIQKQNELNVFKTDIQSFTNSAGYTHLEFIYDRLVNVHKENPNTDYMHKFRENINTINFYLGKG